MSDFAAERLSMHHGTLELNGLSEISDMAAKVSHPILTFKASSSFF